MYPERHRNDSGTIPLRFGYDSADIPQPILREIREKSASNLQAAWSPAWIRPR